VGGTYSDRTSIAQGAGVRRSTLAVAEINHRAGLIQACKAVLAAQLTLSAFNTEFGWLAGSDSTFDRTVFADLVDGVEHTPGYWLRREVNHQAWRREPMYHQLRVDLSLLQEGETDNDGLLLSCRAKLEPEASELSDNELRARVRSCLHPLRPDA